VFTTMLLLLLLIAAMLALAVWFRCRQREKGDRHVPSVAYTPALHINATDYSLSGEGCSSPCEVTTAVCVLYLLVWEKSDVAHLECKPLLVCNTHALQVCFVWCTPFLICSPKRAEGCLDATQELLQHTVASHTLPLLLPVCTFKCDVMFVLCLNLPFSCQGPWMQIGCLANL